MDNNTIKKSKEEGKRTWSALENQWAEAVGFFSAMFQSFIRVFKKQFLGFLLFAVVFGAGGGLYAWFKKDVFHSQMTVSYSQLEKKIYGDMLFKLNQLVENKQVQELSDLLKMSDEQIMEIKSIRGFNIHNQELTSDLSVEKVPFYIEVEVYNPNILKELEEALVHYISQSDFVYERLKLNERNYKKEIDHLKNQLIYMDSLKVLLMSNCADLDGDVVENLNTLNESQNVIFGKIRDFESALQFNMNIEVMDGFIAQHQSKSKQLIFYVILGMAIGIGFRLLYLIFR
jgi:multidrug efflux pump subunit AcrB